MPVLRLPPNYPGSLRNHRWPGGSRKYIACLRRQQFSFLTLRTPERRKTALGESSHHSFTPGRLAFFAFAVVDLKRMLEIAEFACGLAVIAQRRAAGLDGLIQHRVNRRNQTLGMIGRFTFFSCQ